MKGSRAEATVFLGGGRITSALIAGLRSSGYEQPIVVHDRDAQKLGHLKRQYSVTIEHDLRRAVDQAHLLIIAVRPDGISRLLDAIGSVKRPITAISLAAGVHSRNCAPACDRPYAGYERCRVQYAAVGAVSRL